MAMRDVILAMFPPVFFAWNERAPGIGVGTFLKKGLVISAVVFLVMASSASAQSRLLIVAEANVYVSENAPVSPMADLRLGLLSTGVGRGGPDITVGRIISYVRFDLGEIPNATAFNDIIIDSAQLRLLAQSFGLAGRDDRFLVTVSYCPESEWSESTMTWNTRVCEDSLVGEDSAIIDGNDLPRIYTWDVTRSMAEAKAGGEFKITFVVDAVRLLDEPREIVAEEWVGFVRFWSRERVRFGVSAVPTLEITHSSHPTPLMSFLGSMLVVLSAVGVIVGLYGAIRGVRSRIRRKSDS